MSDEPRIGISMGDPGGVGPELVVRALASDGDEGVTVFGDASLLAQAATRLGLPIPRRVVSLSSLSSLSHLSTRAPVANVASLPSTVSMATGASLSVGAAQPVGATRPAGGPLLGGGEAQVAYLEALVAAATRGEIDALVTAPINKHACRSAGFAFPGHTEFLAHRLGAAHVAMMIAGPHLRVVPATIHMALARVPAGLEHLAETMMLTVRALADDFSIASPRVAVCGLNPHAGEEGAFGDEEERLIVPAIARARATLLAEGRRFALTGPLVPDAVFRAAAAPPYGEGLYDAVVGMYHDQALIPVKLLDFDEAVNVTLGLPLPRTSPDHGVAYDVVGTDRVRDGSFRAALHLARELARRRPRGAGSLC